MRLSLNQKCNDSKNKKEPKTEYKACFKHCATAVPNSIDQIKFDFSTAVVQRLKPSHATQQYNVARLGFKHCATAVPNSIHKLEYIRTHSKVC